MTLLKPQWFYALATTLVVWMEGDVLLEYIRNTKKIKK